MVRVHGTQQGAGASPPMHAALLRTPIPYEGGKQAVAEAWRNLTAVGRRAARASPTISISAIRKSPRSWARSSRPSTAWARPAARWISRSCRGNVSLYNETNGVGHPADARDRRRRPDRRLRQTADARASSGRDEVVVADRRDHRASSGQSLYLRELVGREDGAPPPVDLDGRSASTAISCAA